MSALKQLKQLKPETPEQREQRQRRQRFHKRRKKAGIKEVRRYVDLRFLEFLLTEIIGFLPRGIDYSDDDIVIGYLSYEAEWHGYVMPAYTAWQLGKDWSRIEAQYIWARLARPAMRGTIRVVADAVVVRQPAGDA
jgi:hypothetical protein